MFSLVVEDLTVTYLRPNSSAKRASSRGGNLLNGRRERVLAIDGASFTADQGEIIGVVGGNGAGKSSMLSALAQDIPYRGTVRAPSRPRLVQMGRLLPRALTGRQQIDLVVRSLIDDKELIAHSIEHAVEFTGIGTAIDAPVATYSKGMRSRVNFSALTVGSPDVLLIDEALAVGDSAFVKRAARHVRKLAEEGSTILLADHSARRMKYLCGRGLLLENSQVTPFDEVGEALECYQKSSNSLKTP